MLKLLKRTLGIGVFGAAVLLAGSMTANAQSGYYGDGYDQGYYNQNQRSDRGHRKQEKRELKHHQRDERDYYGNSRDLRRHQQQEKRQVKQHQRYERNDGYYDNRRRVYRNY